MVLLSQEQASPAREADAQMITLCTFGSTCTITLNHFSHDGGRVNAEKWALFGWKVISDDGK